MRDLRLTAIELGAAAAGATCATLLTSYAFPLPRETSIAVGASTGCMFAELANAQYRGVPIGTSAFLRGFAVYAAALLTNRWLS